MIFEKIVFTQKETLHFGFNGRPKKKGIDKQKLNNLINKIFDNYSFGNDLIRIISYVRTILKDYKETYLTIGTSVGKTRSSVRYVNGKLMEYNRTGIIKEDWQSYELIECHYDANRETSFKFAGAITEEGIFPQVKKFVSDSLSYIRDLQDEIGPVKLTEEDKVFINVYELFYGEKPDFSDNDIISKIQNMVFLISDYGISFEQIVGDIGFSIFDKYPESSILTQYIIRLVPLANNLNCSHNINLRASTFDIIQMLGNKVRTSFTSDNNLTFERFCTALYIKEYRSHSKISLKELSDKILKNYTFYFSNMFSEDELEYYFNLKSDMDKEYEKVSEKYE